MQRQNGYYWAKTVIGESWIITKYENGIFYRFHSNEIYKEEDFHYIRKTPIVIDFDKKYPWNNERTT